MPRAAPLLALLAILIAGCAREPAPLDLVVEARDGAALNRWRYRQLHVLTGPFEQEFDYALQQLRYNVMALETGLPPAEIDRRVNAGIHQRPVRDVIVAGYLVERRRVQDHIAGEERVLDSQLRQLQRPDTDEPTAALLTRHMEAVRIRQSEKIVRLREVEARIQALSGLPPDEAEQALVRSPAQPRPGRSGSL